MKPGVVGTRLQAQPGLHKTLSTQNGNGSGIRRALVPFGLCRDPLSGRTQGRVPVGLQHLPWERPPAGGHRPPAGGHRPPRGGVRPSHGGRHAPGRAGPAGPAALAWRAGPGRPALTSGSSAIPPRPARMLVRRELPGRRPRPPSPCPALPWPPGPAVLTRSPRACAAAGRADTGEEGGGGGKRETLRKSLTREGRGSALRAGPDSGTRPGLRSELGALLTTGAPWRPAPVDGRGVQDR